MIRLSLQVSTSIQFIFPFICTCVDTSRIAVWVAIHAHGYWENGLWVVTRVDGHWENSSVGGDTCTWTLGE